MQKKFPPKCDPSDPWKIHQEESVIFVAENTTPLQRLEWLEAMLVLLRDYAGEENREDRF